MFKKKGIILCMVACLLVATSIAATASETDWLFIMRAGTPTNTNYSLALQMGTRLAAQDGKGTEDAFIPSPTYTMATASVVSYQPDLPQNSLYTSDRRAPLTGAETKVWDIRLWANASYPNNPLRLIWYTVNYALPTSINGVPYRYWLHVYDDPTGEHQDEIIRFDDGIPVYNAPYNPTQYLDWTTYPKLGSASDISDAIKMRFVAAPVPEPGSLFVLISGLASTTALAFRRRS